MYQCVAGNKHGEVYSNAELRVIGRTLALCARDKHKLYVLACGNAHKYSSLFSSLPSCTSASCCQMTSGPRLCATNWKASIIRWMRVADSDMPELLCSPASLSFPVKPVTLKLCAASSSHSIFILPTCLILIMLLRDIRCSTSRFNGQTRTELNKRQGQSWGVTGRGEEECFQSLVKVWGFFFSCKLTIILEID